jgi:hypothetical protein
MTPSGEIDRVRLQDTLDDIAGTVAWAADYIELLHEDQRGLDLSDLPGLLADLDRLRVVADALVPGRVRDAGGHRWYLAPDDAARRSGALEVSLDEADQKVNEAFASQDRARDEAKTKEQKDADRRAREQAQREEQKRDDRAAVQAFLASRGPSTLAEIVRGTGIDEWRAELAAKSAAKRGRDRRFVLDPTK